MDGAEALRPGEAHRHSVRLDDGSLLNRYWDDRDTPREEAFREDEATAERSSRPAAEVYRDLRAAAASGWDFSARWCDATDDLSTIRTTALLPVDLNSLLYKLESEIARLSAATGEEAAAADFAQRARQRRAAIDHWLWDERQSCYVDYDWQRERPGTRLTAATVAPLFVDAATPAQVALAWSLQQGFSVIPSSTKRENLASNLLAQDLHLDADDMAAIAALDRNGREVDPPGLAPAWD